MGKKGKKKSKRVFKKFKKTARVYDSTYGKVFGSKSVDRKWKKRARRRSMQLIEY